MKALRRLLTVLSLLLLSAVGFVWLNRSVRVDMAGYVPADSLVYIEFNSLTDLAKTIEQNETWKSVATAIGSDSKLIDPFWITMARTGVAPVRSVAFARAQMAVVLLGVNSIQEGDTLKIRPEVALVVETHTANWRIRSSAIEAVKTLSNYAYGQSNCSERTAEAYFVECSSSTTGRKLVGAIDGTVVIVANSDNAVRACLDVRSGFRPSLRTDVELARVRDQVRADGALSFGYVSSANVAKIFSWAAPLLMGKAPGDTQLEELLARSAGKILKAIAWTSRASSGTVEDRYLFTLDADVLQRLQPAFTTTSVSTDEIWKYVPATVEQLTFYEFNDALAALTAMNSAVASKLDAVSSIMFSSLLRSSLSVYGIDKPGDILPLLSSPLVTLRAHSTDESSVLLARTIDQNRLRHALQSQVVEGGLQIVDGVNSSDIGNQQFSAVLLDGYVVIGKSESIRSWLDAIRSNEGNARPSRFKQWQPAGGSVTVTYANDQSRVNSFVSAVAAMRGKPLSPEQTTVVADKTKDCSSLTESKLNGSGIERLTRSSFGQLSTLLALVQSDTTQRRR